MAGSPEPVGLLPLLAGAPEQVAPRLLGAVLRHGEVALWLTEVEAYAGQDDPGSHAFRGPTPRTEVMFGPAGRLYTYFSYGMHVCANVVVGPEGRAGAVLLRAGEVLEGHDVVRARRPRSTERDLTRGPARLCEALAITLEHGGVDLSAGPVTLEPGPAPRRWESGPRVGLRQAAERPWRFWLPGEPSVSTYRPAAPRRTR